MYNWRITGKTRFWYQNVQKGMFLPIMYKSQKLLMYHCSWNWGAYVQLMNDRKSKILVSKCSERTLSCFQEADSLWIYPQCDKRYIYWHQVMLTVSTNEWFADGKTDKETNRHSENNRYLTYVRSNKHTVCICLC